MRNMGRCSFAGLGERGSFLQLLSVEWGFLGRLGTMVLGTAGWHMPGCEGLCSALTKDPAAICYLAVSSVFSHCPQRRRHSLPAALLQGGIFPKTKINLLEEIPWNQSFSSQVSATELLESYFHFTVHSQQPCIFTVIIIKTPQQQKKPPHTKKQRENPRNPQNFSLDLHFANVLYSSPHIPALLPLAQLLAKVWLKSVLCMAHSSNSKNIRCIKPWWLSTLVPAMLKARCNYCLTHLRKNLLNIYALTPSWMEKNTQIVFKSFDCAIIQELRGQGPSLFCANETREQRRGLGEGTDTMMKWPHRRIYSFPKAQTNPSVRRQHWATWSLKVSQQQRFPSLGKPRVSFALSSTSGLIPTSKWHQNISC